MENLREKLSNLFIVNPAIQRNKDIYIWISDNKDDLNNMIHSFNYCIEHDIYFKGFVSNCISIIGITVLNKMVYDVDKITDEDPLVLSEDDCSNLYCPVEILNPEVNISNLVIWGAGHNGKVLAEYFYKKNIPIKYFIDSDKKKIGSEINGAKIHGIEKLKELAVGDSLVEASNKYVEIDKIVQENAPKIDCYFYRSVGIDRYIMPNWLMYLREVLKNKNVYIYGYNDTARRYGRCLSVFDYSFKGFLVDAQQYDDVFNHDHRFLLPEEILYCENYFVIIASAEQETSIKKLQELGLQYSIDFSPVEIISYNLLYARKNIIDTNLGHTYKQTTGMNGIDVYGNQGSENYKIVVLGGSTTDGKLFPFKSWPQIMYEKMNNDHVTVYNGGVSGYTSAQELIKLIRDIVLLKPDMIIVYDGYNDTSEVNASPGKYFDFIYLKKALDFSRNHMNHDWDVISQEDDTEIESAFPVLGNFENWLMNIEMMHAIAVDRGIRFYSFLQPMLSSKKNLSKEELGVLFEAEHFIGLQKTSAMGKEFREKIGNALLTHDYIYDLSHIFDDCQNVYMDLCHVREGANELIAEEILDRIKICL